MNTASPNDAGGVEHEQSRQVVVRAVGETASERYLAKLGQRSFLNLWSYPNVFTDRGVKGSGDGKELCDLLVVFGDHVLIFSDKTIAWPSTDDPHLAWRRWYKRAVQASSKQVAGAARWISQFPDRLFLDKSCTQPLPINLPSPERIKIHGIVVALGAGKASCDHFGGGIGSLMIVPDIKGDDHFKESGALPFSIGDVFPSSYFMHVLDDATLDIVMGELDTIKDFTEYLSKKEKLLRGGGIVIFCGRRRFARILHDEYECRWRA